MSTFIGIRFIASTLLSAVGLFATYVAVQNLQDSGNRLGFTFTPGGANFDIEVPALVISLALLLLGITFLWRTFTAARAAHPENSAPQRASE